jgi:hypothetical protein
MIRNLVTLTPCKYIILGHWLLLDRWRILAIGRDLLPEVVKNLLIYLRAVITLGNRDLVVVSVVHSAKRNSGHDVLNLL